MPLLGSQQIGWEALDFASVTTQNTQCDCYIISNGPISVRTPHYLVSPCKANVFIFMSTL